MRRMSSERARQREKEGEGGECSPGNDIRGRWLAKLEAEGGGEAPATGGAPEGADELGRDLGMGLRGVREAWGGRNSEEGRPKAMRVVELTGERGRWSSGGFPMVWGGARGAARCSDARGDQLGSGWPGVAANGDGARIGGASGVWAESRSTRFWERRMRDGA